MSNTEKRFVCHSCESNPHVEGCPYIEYLVELDDDTRGPAPGTWADVARMMASFPTEEGEPPIDWDAWKDQMKEQDL